MTNHAGLDLSYGHLGEAVYGAEEGLWRFSMHVLQHQSAEQLHPWTQSQPPSFQDAPPSGRFPSKIARSQSKWLAKSRPETLPASIVTSTFQKAHSATERDVSSGLGQQVALGRAVYVDHKPGYRTDPIIAIPGGEAGHVLRLIRPHVESCAWGKKSSVKLSLLDAASSSIGYWVGNGGPIYQITFAGEYNESSELLAVRQASEITIFRPMYHRQPIPAVVPSGYAKQYPSSRLSVNPVTVLTADKCGSKRHADVSFNPFYSRQFGTVDDRGRWSIWDLEGTLRNDSTLELVSGKSGHIFDNLDPTSTSKNLCNADGWHRILWVVNVSTIVVCSRRHIAVFNIEAAPTRLQSPEFDPAKTTDWILDIKRSPTNSSHLFLLTTSRIIWLEVIADKVGENFRGLGIHVIISHFHFRDANDETLSLKTVVDGNLSALITSSKSLLITCYTFSMSAGDSNSPTSSRGSFTLSAISGDQPLENLMPQTLCFLPSQLVWKSDRKPGPGQEQRLIEQNARFYQAWALGPALTLYSTLCAFYTVSTAGKLSSRTQIQAPMTRTSSRSRPMESTTVVADSFAVLDEEVNEDGIDHLLSKSFQHGQFLSINRIVREDIRLKMNWKWVFQHIFMRGGLGNFEKEEAAISLTSVTELLDSIADQVQRQKEKGSVSTSSFIELAPLLQISDLELAAPILKDFLKGLQDDQNSGASASLVLTSLNSCPGIRFPIRQGSIFPDVLDIYIHAGEPWLASLPLKVPNISRWSKFRMARQLAVELWLSSILASIRLKPPQMETTQGQLMAKINSTLLNTQGDHPRDDITPLMFSQIPAKPSENAGLQNSTSHTLPYSYKDVPTNRREPTEDPTVSRLRQYAVSIKSQPDLGKSTLLDPWPPSPGSDPSQSMNGYIANCLRLSHEAQSHQTDRMREREEARRGRRTNRFLTRGITKVSEAKSQPDYTQFGSQPEFTAHARSSQIFEDIPMSQPDRGVFGSRSAQLVKKKRKPRAAGF